MAHYEVGPCTCGHMMDIDADSPEQALETAVSLAPSHIEEYHQDDPMYEQLKAMTLDETTAMMRPMVHFAPTERLATQPLFGEEIPTDDAD